MSEPKSDPPFLVIIILLLALVTVLSLLGLTPANIIEVGNETEAKILAEQLRELIGMLILYTFVPFAIIVLLYASRPPLAQIIYQAIKEKYDLWYFRHFPHKVPFGEKWNRMLERLEYMAWLEKKGYHFTWEDV